MLFRYLHGAVRTLTHQPGLSISVIAVLAIGIGATTTMFSVVDALLINPLPVPAADRVVYLYRYNAELDIVTSPSPEMIRELHDSASSFEGVATYAEESFFVGGDNEPARLHGARVSPGFFDFLGIQSRLGRLDLGEQDTGIGGQGVVLSYGLWQRRFGGSDQVLGRIMEVGDQRLQVIGVLPSGFRLESYSPLDLWIAETPASERTDSDGPVYAVARLTTGSSVAAAAEELASLSQHLPADETGLAWTGIVETPRSRLDSRRRTAVLALQAAVVLVLLLACGNVAGLLLAHGETRHQELAVRSAMGASRGDLLRQLLTESLLLGLLAGTVGVAVARVGVVLIPDLLPGTPAYLELGIGHLAFTLAAALASSLLFGLFPALKGSSVDMRDVLLAGLRIAGGPSRRLHLRRMLVAGQVALAVVLLLGAGLLLRSFARLQAIDPGFDPDGLLTLRLELPEAADDDTARLVSFGDRLRAEVSGIVGPGAPPVVLASGIASDIEAITGHPELEDQPVAADSPRQLLITRSVMPDFFKGMGIRLIRGRGFTEAARSDTEAEVIVNETLARRCCGGIDPVGRRIRFGNDWYRVVGVAADVSLPSLVAQGLGDLQVYFPFAQRPSSQMTLAIRITSRSSNMVEALKAAVWRVDPTAPITRVASAPELLTDSIDRQRTSAALMAGFAACAVLLACLGVYGVIAHSVRQRTREIGIRLALGAMRAEVTRQVVAQGLRLVVIGAVIGLAAALALSRSLSSLLFQVRPWDPASVVLAGVVVIGAALLACWLPARRAAALDPGSALRHD
jgi:putative ABC transport system permease protein